MTTLPACFIELGLEQERAVDHDLVAGCEAAQDLDLTTQIATTADRSRFDHARVANGVKTDHLSLDSDASTEGIQPYRDPSDRPILTLADTHWFGPSETWPRELPNYPYIEFWHRLDAALLAWSIPGMGQELLGDAAWRSLFSSGNLAENPRIQISVSTSPSLSVQRLSVDQRGTARAPGAPGDIGAIELR